ncbi:MAG: hypothetical protein H7248_00570 [Microbacteriaceae bacterium]|nr:hypothetical protein [Microbacteriaceae bacterium]
MSPEEVAKADGGATPADQRLAADREALEFTREAFWAVCGPVNPPKLARDYVDYFCARLPANVDEAKKIEAIQKNAPRRRSFYDAGTTYLQAYSALERELARAGYSPREVTSIEKEVEFFEGVLREVRLAAGETTE